MNSVEITDFPIHDHKVMVVLRRRCWADTRSGKSFFLPLSINIIVSGTCYSKKFGSFLVPYPTMWKWKIKNLCVCSIERKTKLPSCQKDLTLVICKQENRDFNKLIIQLKVWWCRSWNDNWAQDAVWKITPIEISQICFSKMFASAGRGIE